MPQNKEEQLNRVSSGTAIVNRSQKEREQIKTLVLLACAFLGIFFWPSVKWTAMCALTSRKPLLVQGIEVIVPQAWMIRSNGRELGGWKPCLTILCSSPSSAFSLTVEEKLIGHEDGWQHAAEETLNEERYPGPSVKNIQSSVGTIICLEASRLRGNVADTISTCLEPHSGFTAGFQGRQSLVGDFYKILSTARR
jgi:hypothetical protein